MHGMILPNDVGIFSIISDLVWVYTHATGIFGKFSDEIFPTLGKKLPKIGHK